MNPGRLDKRVTFLRRLEDDDGAGNHRGDFVAVLIVWAEFRPTGGREVVEGGRLTDVVDGVLVIRDSAVARQITAADRAQLRGGGEYAIVSVAEPDRRAGTIQMSVARKQG